jgi:hypothetical protein
MLEILESITTGDPAGRWLVQDSQANSLCYAIAPASTHRSPASRVSTESVRLLIEISSAKLPETSDLPKSPRSGKVGRRFQWA